MTQPTGDALFGRWALDETLPAKVLAGPIAADPATEGFDPGQPRDKDGKWSKTPGSGLGKGQGPTLPRRARQTQRPERATDLAGMLELDLSSAANRDMLKEAMSEVIDGDHSGLWAEVNGVERYDGFGVRGDRSGMLVSGRIYPNEIDGDEAGTFQRAFYRDDRGDLIAVHAYLRLESQYRGRGFATAFNGRLEDWYRRQGVTRIDLLANIDVGGYAWAAAGYDFADPEEAQEMLDRLREMTQEQLQDAKAQMRKAHDARDAQALRQTQAVLAQLQEARDILARADRHSFGTDGYPSAYEISQCGRSASDGQTWIGKTTMLGTDWFAIKWL